MKRRSLAGLLVPGIAPTFPRPNGPAAVRLTLMAKLTVPTGPKSIYLMPDGKHVWANCLYAHRCVMIDVATRGIVRTFKLPGEPVEGCFTEGGRLAWISQYNRGTVVVLDTESGRLLHTLKVGKVPKIVAASPDGAWVYVANFDSAEVTIINARQFQVVRTTKVRRHPRGTCFTPDSRFAYVACMGGAALAKFAVTENHRLVGYVPAGTTPRHAVTTRRGHRIYVSNNLTAQVSKVDVQSESVIASCRVGRQARTIALAPDESLLAVCNNAADSISLVNTLTMQELLRMPTGKHPIGCTFADHGRQLWVSSYPWSRVYVYRVERG